jgi:hypothetical protein
MSELPERVGLCPVHQREFYMPDPDQHGICPECPEHLAIYVRAGELDELREAVRAYLVGAPLDEHGRFKDSAREALYRAVIAPRSEP